MFLDLNGNMEYTKLDRGKFRSFLHSTFEMTDDTLLDRGNVKKKYHLSISVFRAFDMDLDGLISVDDWIRGLSVFLRGNLVEKAKCKPKYFSYFS